MCAVQEHVERVADGAGGEREAGEGTAGCRRGLLSTRRRRRKDVEEPQDNERQKGKLTMIVEPYRL